MSVKVNLKHSNIEESLVKDLRNKAASLFESMWEDAIPGDQGDPSLHYTGWLDYPVRIEEEEIRKIEDMAKEIKSRSSYLLVIGTGGSYMGARAVTDLIAGEDQTKLLFLGYDINERHILEVLKTLEGKDYSLCVVSKSGGTMEPMVSFSIMMEDLKARYGEEEAFERTYVITENKDSLLHDYARETNCHILYVPENIGGRYSVFTAVGLLPMAVHGADIREFVNGAKALASRDAFDGEGLDYAITRLLLGGYGHGTMEDAADAFDDAWNSRCGKSMEVFEVYDTYAEYFGNWLLQLFGESEGKEGKGIFPTLLLFNRDLHSIGQFLQEGRRDFFETMILFGDRPNACSMAVPDTPLASDLAGLTLGRINRSVEEGVIAAHSKAGVPLITIGIEEISPRSIGGLMYYFMVQSAVSALLMGLNPFNQPGVEKYKREIRNLILSE